jgi:hypothetical protein
MPLKRTVRGTTQCDNKPYTSTNCHRLIDHPDGYGPLIGFWGNGADNEFVEKAAKRLLD